MLGVVKQKIRMIDVNLLYNKLGYSKTQHKSVTSVI